MVRGLRDEIDRYLADCRQALEDLVRSFAEADPALESLTLEAGRHWQDVRTGVVSNPTIATRARALKTFSAWVADEGDLPADPFVRLRLPRLDRRLKVVPTDEELATVLKVAGPEGQAILLVLAGTGMRVGDLCGLSLDDLADETLTLRDTKTRDDRLVPLDQALLAAVHFYAAELRPVARSPFERHLFLTRRGNPYRPELIAALVHRCCDRAGLGPRRFTPHALRHWYARDLIAHDTHPMVAAARGGWKTLQMLTHYARVNDEMMRADVARYAPAARIAGSDWHSASVGRYAATSSKSRSSGRTSS